MAKVEIQIIDGITFRRYVESPHASDREYFKGYQVGVGRTWAHRYVWEKHNGRIPNGYHVHHIDGDKANNVIGNLECLSAKEHARAHPFTPQQKAKNAAQLDSVRELAKKWHSSPDGIALHRRLGKLVSDAKVPRILVCDVCNSLFNTKGAISRFCSNRCKSKWRRDAGLDDIEKQCLRCGDNFTTNKYSKAVFCSRKCAANRGQIGLTYTCDMF